jgi:hypothetical protein
VAFELIEERQTPARKEMLIVRTVRFPIAGLMGAVLVVAIGLAALRNASETWAGVTFLLTCGVLGLAVVGVVCRNGQDRAWWLGFALFGWGYLVLAFRSTLELPTMALLDALGARLGVTTVRFGGGMGGGMGGGFGGVPDQSIQHIAHCLWALLLSLLGSVVAGAIFGAHNERGENPDAPRTPLAAHSRPRCWLWAAMIAVAGSVSVAILASLGSSSSSLFWAGATFFATCGLLGMALLGAVGSRGRRRQVWFGAALFGIGYMTMAFGRSLDRETWPTLPTDELLYVARHWFPPVVGGFHPFSTGVAAANARIWVALEQPVPIPFPEDTPLEDVLKYIQITAHGPDGKGIPIYVDPMGLQEAEKTLTSTVRIDLEGVALKTTLRLCLDQLDLSYSIRDGLLLITSQGREATPVYQDPFLIVGHCLLALLAAGFGGLVAPLLAASRAEPLT